jgi:hypothetical protein
MQAKMAARPASQRAARSKSSNVSRRDHGFCL